MKLALCDWEDKIDTCGFEKAATHDSAANYYENDLKFAEFHFFDGFVEGAKCDLSHSCGLLNASVIKKLIVFGDDKAFETLEIIFR